MRSDAYWIDGPWTGRLAIVPRPRGEDWLEDEILAWQQSDIKVIVSLLTQEEVAEFGLELQKALCDTHGIEFVSFPIPDRGIPASESAATMLIHNLGEQLAGGANVGVHCRQCIGRSALIAASLLVASGLEPKLAFDRVAASRRASVPDTAEQEQWVAQRSAALALQPTTKRAPALPR